MLAAALPADRAPSGAPTRADRLDGASRRTRCALEQRARRPPPTALVANLPYNVAVPVLLHLLETLPERCGTGWCMVQAEVADRLAAAPGDRTYGVPSVKAAWWASVRRAGAVPRAVFWPVPNVDSGLVAFDRREPPASAAGRAAVFACVDAAFAQRRKTLRAALAGLAGSAGTRPSGRCAPPGIDPRTRGEQLGVAAVRPSSRTALAGLQPAAPRGRRGSSA